MIDNICVKVNYPIDGFEKKLEEVVPKLKMFDEFRNRCAKLITALELQEYLTKGMVCNVLKLECENPYEFYFGDKQKWLDMIGMELSDLSREDYESEEYREYRLMEEALTNAMMKED